MASPPPVIPVTANCGSHMRDPLFVKMVLPTAHRWAVGRRWQTRATPRMKMRFVDGDHRLSNQT